MSYDISPSLSDVFLTQKRYFELSHTEPSNCFMFFGRTVNHILDLL